MLDFFRRGEVAPDIRMMAARGALAPRAHEQLGLLALLLEDADPAIRTAAEETIGRIPAAALSAFLARSDVASELREVFVARGMQPATELPTDSTSHSDDPLISTDDEEAEDDSHDVSLEPVQALEGTTAPPDEPDRQSTVHRLGQMKISQRVKLAMRGSREERAVLIRDPNKLVALAVLSSPKVNDSEIESYARMSSVSEEVLRVIGTSRAWVKNYGVMAALTRNPKTPVAISIGLIHHLSEKDQTKIMSDRNVPEGLRLAARKIVMNSQTRRH